MEFRFCAALKRQFAPHRGEEAHADLAGWAQQEQAHDDCGPHLAPDA